MQSCKNVQILKKLAFMQCLDDLQFKLIFLNNLAFLQCLDHLNFLCIFHKQAGSESGSGSEIKVKVGSGSEKKKKKKFGSTTLVVTMKICGLDCRTIL